MKRITKIALSAALLTSLVMTGCSTSSDSGSDQLTIGVSIATSKKAVYKFMQKAMATVENLIAKGETIDAVLANGSWRGAALQAVDLVIAACIYYPFFKLWEKKTGTL